MARESGETISSKKHPEYQYLDLMRSIIDDPNDEGQFDDRAVHLDGDQGIRCTFGALHHYNLQKDGFPLLTTKQMPWKGVARELLWFLSGDTNIKTLVDQGVNIWVPDAYRRYQRAVNEDRAPVLSEEEYIARLKDDSEFSKWGELGPVYGAQWRDWQTPWGGRVDQIAQLVNQLRDPIYRYRKSLIVDAWNPSNLPGNAPTEDEEMALPPCHYAFQVDVTESDQMSLLLNQRSADIFLGVPFNIASYALLTEMLAHVTGLKANYFVHQFGNAHVYHRHFEQAREQLSREPYPFPKIELNPAVKELNDFTIDDINIVDYRYHPRIRATMAAVGGRIDNPQLKPQKPQ
jgi:thymidylate synthase